MAQQCQTRLSAPITVTRTQHPNLVVYNCCDFVFYLVLHFAPVTTRNVDLKALSHFADSIIRKKCLVLKKNPNHYHPTLYHPYTNNIKNLKDQKAAGGYGGYGGESSVFDH
ncbi:hypothetical protein QTP88_029036 [Uroleucon formosanum]